MKAIIFDLDNTLTHREQTIRNYASIFLADYSAQLIPALDSGWFADKLVTLDEGGYAGHDVRSQRLAMLDIWLTRPDAVQLQQHWHTWMPHHPVPMPGLYPVLEKLKQYGYRLGIITNGQGSNQRAKIAALNIADYFDVIIVSEEVGVKKPAPAIFTMALSSLNISADQAMYIGDHPVNDYQGARNAGIKAVWFRGFMLWPDDWSAAQSTIDHLEHLLDKV